MWADVVWDTMIEAYHDGTQKGQIEMAESRRNKGEDEMVVAFTGHRPTKLGQAWDGRGRGDMFLRGAMEEILTDLEATHVIVGGALGVDQNAARVAYKMGIPYSVYIPFEGQEGRWPGSRQEAYRKMLELADGVYYISPPGYSVEKMQIRNMAMRRDSHIVIAFCENPDSPGGTRNMIRHCNEVGHPIRVYSPVGKGGLFKGSAF